MDTESHAPADGGGSAIDLPSARTFPGAAQPSIIRSQQKDQFYLQQLTESCQDAVRRILGPRRALELDREIHLLADVLYYGLTTGTGLQTLGEEYCDILQATGPSGVAPGTLQRGMLVLLQSIGPYVAEKAFIASHQDSMPHIQHRQSAPTPSSSQAQNPSAAAAAPPTTDAEIQEDPSRQEFTPNSHHYSGLQNLADRIQRYARQMKCSIQSAAQPTINQYWPPVQRFLATNGGGILRLNLALFYIFGVYYQLSKRFTGVRYLFIGRLLERKPSYSILGLVLFLQLGITGGVQLLKAYGKLPQQLFGHRLGDRNQEEKPRPAALLNIDGSEITPLNEQELASSSGKSIPGEVPQSMRCPLCLSQRECPTATPCGHVFCWQCIVEWSTQKPECPLCRAEVVPSSLVCVRYSDF